MTAGGPRPGYAHEVVGVVPAAGRARRLGSPAASKELAPVYRPADGGPVLPVSYRLLHAYAEARIPRALVVTRSAKADLRRVLGDGDPSTPRLTHIELPDSPSPAYTVAAATRMAGDAPIALGFPDVLWDGPDAFSRLLGELARLDADAVLGLFPHASDYPTQGVELAADGRVLALHDPAESGGPDHFAWTLAVWTSTMSRQLEVAVEARYGSDANGSHDGDELGLTEILRDAVEAGLVVRGLSIATTPFLDTGDPERLAEASRRAELRSP